MSVEVLVCNHRRSWRARKVVLNGVNVTFAPSLLHLASVPISLSYPHLLRSCEGDILHVHAPFPLADISVLFQSSVRKHFSKIVVSWHGDIVRQRMVMSLYEPILRRFLDLADSIIVATPNHISVSPTIGTLVKKTVVIPFGFRLTGAEFVKDEELVRSIRNRFGDRLVLFVGRLVYYKGVEYLIDAMANLRDAQLVIIGSGPLKDRLESRIRGLGLGDRVTILPPVSRKDLIGYYHACNVFALPSTEISEGFGIVQVEAMACGKPVVSTDLSTGVTYVNQHGRTGLTVPARDPLAFAAALRSILSDDALARRLGEQARERVLAEFQSEIMIAQISKLYNSLLS